jgi:hypothetical protein
MGLQDKGFNDNDSSSIAESDSTHGGADYSGHNSRGGAVKYATAQDRTTALSTKSAFLQMDGRSAVTVDSQGVFISIPVPLPSDSHQILNPRYILELSYTFLTTSCIDFTTNLQYTCGFHLY